MELQALITWSTHLGILRTLADWAHAINSIFPRTAETPGLYVWANENFNGKGTGLPEGEITKPELSLYSLTPEHIKAVKVETGYKATLYTDVNLEGEGIGLTGSVVPGEELSGKVASVRIEKTSDAGVDATLHDAGSSLIVTRADNNLAVSGVIGGEVELLDISGRKVVGTITSPDGNASLQIPAPGAYVVTSGTESAKILVR